MSKTETMLIEIGALCAVFENLLQGQSKVVVQQFNTVCEMARKEITEKDKTIESLQAKVDELTKERDDYFRMLNMPGQTIGMRLLDAEAKVDELTTDRLRLIRSIYAFWDNRRDNAGFIAHFEDNKIFSRPTLKQEVSDE